MNNKLEVIGIDHGWSMMKTISQVFVTGVKEITTTPALFGDVLEYEGKFYKVGTVRQLENLFNGLHENIDFLEKKIEQYQNDLEASKAEYDKPFAYSKELEEKLSRQCELNAQLDLENAKAVDADLSGPEEEREADDRMESAAIVAEDKGAYQADREGRTR